MLCYVMRETQSTKWPCQECGSRIRARVISMQRIQTPSIPSLKKRENLRSKCVRSQREPRGVNERGDYHTHSLTALIVSRFLMKSLSFRRALQGDSAAGTFVRTSQEGPGRVK